jgi:hypothetical protein
MAFMNGPMLPSPARPFEVATQLAEAPLRDEEGNRLLVRWRERWMQWIGPHWAEVPDEAVISRIYRLTSGAVYEWSAGKLRPWPAREATVKAVLHALKAVIALPNETEPNTWLDDPADRTEAISFANGLLFLDESVLYEHDPAFFNLDFEPYAYRPDDPTMMAHLAPRDPVAAFVRECCIRDYHAVLPKHEVRAAFERWAAQFQERAPRMALPLFSRELIRVVGPDLRTANRRYGTVQTHVFVGLRLKPDAIAT